MRLFFGIWILYAGVMKWLGGADGFVNHIVENFDKTWSPHLLNVVLGWLIIVAEPLGALFILSGKRPRCAWTLMTLLLFLLLIGQVILGSRDILANWFYVVLALVCASLSDPEPSSCCNKQ